MLVNLQVSQLGSFENVNNNEHCRFADAGPSAFRPPSGMLYMVEHASGGVSMTPSVKGGSQSGKESFPHRVILHEQEFPVSVQLVLMSSVVETDVLMLMGCLSCFPSSDQHIVCRLSRQESDSCKKCWCQFLDVGKKMGPTRLKSLITPRWYLFRLYLVESFFTLFLKVLAANFVLIMSRSASERMFPLCC